MAMITTCPACRTRFRVTPEQLEAHGGDVRCGRCAKIFLAQNYLERLPEAIEPKTSPVAPPVATEPPLPPTEAFCPPERMPAAETPPPTETVEEFRPPETPSPVAPEEFAQEPGAAVEAAVSTPVEDIEAEEPSPARPKAGAAAPGPTASAKKVASEKSSAAESEPFEEEHLDLILPDWEEHEEVPAETSIFEASADEQPARKKRALFWLWLLGAILLLAGLGGQGLYFFRTDLAARHPDLKPFLQSFCNALQCEIHLPADPDFLSIEASSLEADPAHANLITLNAILRNRAKLAQEYPQLELTLTDTKDQMVARRIFSPKEYAKNADLGRGMPPNEELTVKLHLDLGDLSAAGYRVFLFYSK